MGIAHQSIFVNWMCEKKVGNTIDWLGLTRLLCTYTIGLGCWTWSSWCALAFFQNIPKQILKSYILIEIGLLFRDLKCCTKKLIKTFFTSQQNQVMEIIKRLVTWGQTYSKWISEQSFWEFFAIFFCKPTLFVYCIKACDPFKNSYLLCLKRSIFFVSSSLNEKLMRQ